MELTWEHLFVFALFPAAPAWDIHANAFDNSFGDLRKKIDGQNLQRITNAH